MPRSRFRTNDVFAPHAKAREFAGYYNLLVRALKSASDLLRSGSGIPCSQWTARLKAALKESLATYPGPREYLPALRAMGEQWIDRALRSPDLTEAVFDVGASLDWSRSAERSLTEDEVFQALNEHITGGWGLVSEPIAVSNNMAVISGEGWILSEYKSKSGKRFCIVTNIGYRSFVMLKTELVGFLKNLPG